MDTYALELIRTFNPWALGAVSITGTILWFGIKSKFATKAELENVRSSHEQLEQRVSNLPSRDDIADLKLGVEEMRGEVREINAKLGGLEHMSRLLLENELKDGK